LGEGLILKTEADFSVDAGPAGAPLRAEPPSNALFEQLRALRIEVAVLEERLAAARQIVAEREQRIRDLRAALRLMSTAMASKGGPANGTPDG
jgi:hypothetical protein